MLGEFEEGGRVIKPKLPLATSDHRDVFVIYGFFFKYLEKRSKSPKRQVTHLSRHFPASPNCPKARVLTGSMFSSNRNSDFSVGTNTLTLVLAGLWLPGHVFVYYFRGNCQDRKDT